MPSRLPDLRQMWTTHCVNPDSDEFLDNEKFSLRWPLNQLYSWPTQTTM